MRLSSKGGDAGIDDAAGNTCAGVTIDQAGGVSTLSQVVFILVYLQQDSRTRYWSISR